MRSKPSMASAIATFATDQGSPDPDETGARRPSRRRIWPFGSSLRLGRAIVIVNSVGLLILVVGALVLNEISRGLIQSRVDGLTTQGELIADVIAKQTGSTHDERRRRCFDWEFWPGDAFRRRPFVPRGQRARLYDVDGNMIVDSYIVGADSVEESKLLLRARAGVPAPPPPDRAGAARRAEAGSRQEAR